MENMEGLKGKRILVTGGTGFVGSHLVESLIAKGARVIVPYRSFDPRSYFATKKLERQVILVTCDLKDGGRVYDVVTKYEVEYIFHLGAQAIVATAYHNPVETVASDVMGTAHILEAARRYPTIKGILIASSDKAYGKSPNQYQETDPLQPDHPYEVSKAATDLLAQAYFRTYNLPVVIARFGNIYGEGDLNFNRIIPGIMKSLINEEPLEIRSDGTFVRDYCYVKDVVAGYLLMFEHLKQVAGEAFNFSSDETLSVTGLIAKIEALLKKRLSYHIRKVQKNEIPHQTLRYDKAMKLLGYKPKYTLQATVRDIYRWYTSVL